MVVILYGIKNCDTVRKARQWLDKNAVSYTFHDFRIDGINKTLLKNFLKQIDAHVLINKRGTTWRQLPDKAKKINNKSQAIELMLNNPAIIKRPVLDVNKTYIVGFSDDTYDSILLM